jgi:hypothetical protein
MFLLGSGTVSSSVTAGGEGQYYARRGRQLTRRIARAAARKSWKWVFINLAWTAGPVTFIALQGGHYLGFAKAAPTQNFIYFAGYTVIAGLLAVLASVLHDAIYKPRVQAEQDRLLEVNDQLFSLMLASRNAILEQYEPQERKLLAAYFMLQGAAITPSAVGTAVRDLTGSARLAQAARRIESFADQGMESRVSDEYAAVSDDLYAVREAISTVVPQAFMLLEKRLRGITPRIQEGIERTEGFISRTLQAADEENETLMTLHDASAMIALAFEMLNGRRIAMLDMRLRGDEALERAQKQLDEARQHYRMALRKRNNAIRLFMELCHRHTQTDLAVEASDSVTRMLEAIGRAVPSLPERLQVAARMDFQKIEKLHHTVTRRYDDLEKAVIRYGHVWQKEGKKLAVQLSSSSARRQGWQINEQEVSLTDRQKLELSRRISTLLADVEIRTGRRLRVYDTREDLSRFTAEDYKRLAMGIGNILDEMLDMSQPEEQLAIESSNAPNFGSLELDLSPQTKAGWASICVEVLHANRKRASHKLARNMVDYYNITLSDALIEHLVTHFGADRQYLQGLSAASEEHGPAGLSPLPARPVSLMEWKDFSPKLA